MFPSYIVPTEDILEVLFSISELGNDTTSEEISVFTGYSERKVRESIKVLDELGIIVGEDDFTIDIRYEDKIQEVSPEDRNIVLEEALIEYQPFIDYSSYIKRGYSSSDAIQKVYANNEDISSKPKYLQKYFERLGKETDILADDEGLSVEIREIPVDSVSSIESLRKSLDSELEVRVYLDEYLGSDLMSFLDQDTRNDLTEAYLIHSSQPRASISATGRAFEDFLRNLGETHGEDDRDYSTGSGIVPLCNHLQGDDLIKRHHKRRVMALAEVRNKGGAHGDDTEMLERWTTSPEISLNCAISATLLIKGIYKYAVDEELVL